MRLLSVKGSCFETGFNKSKIVKLTINKKPQEVVISGIANTFGVKKEDRTPKKIFCSIIEKNKFIEFYAKSSNVEGPRWICGAPTLRLGEGIWGPLSRINLGKIKDYSKISAVIDFKTIINRGFSDFSYDIWLTKDKLPPNLKETTNENDIEIMIILNSNFKFPWNIIDENKNYLVMYENKNKNKFARDKGYCIAFFIKNQITKLDLLKIIKQASRYLKINSEDYYLRSIDLINEFSAKTNVNTKLYKLDFDLIKKSKINKRQE